jgi:hypothetical protein
MSANPLAGHDAYCPRCFRLADDDVVFCQFCGQFIHQNAPADSSAWDSRPPHIPAARRQEAPAPSIDLPEDALPYRASSESVADAQLAPEVDEPALPDAESSSEKTDTESA